MITSNSEKLDRKAESNWILPQANTPSPQSQGVITSKPSSDGQGSISISNVSNVPECPKLMMQLRPGIFACPYGSEVVAILFLAHSCFKARSTQ